MMRLRPAAISSTSASRASAVAARFLVWAVAASALLVGFEASLCVSLVVSPFLLGSGFPFAPFLSFPLVAPLVPDPFR